MPCRFVRVAIRVARVLVPTGYFQEVLRQWLLLDKPTVGELAAALNTVGREMQALELPDKVAEKLGKFLNSF